MLVCCMLGLARISLPLPFCSFSSSLPKEFTRRVSSLDLVIAHVGMTAFFIPMRFLHHAPPSTYWGVMITGIVVYVVAFYVGMALMKVGSSPFFQVLTMLMLVAYMVVYYAAGTLGQLIVDSGMPHLFWMLLNFLVIQLIVLKERTRVSHSDPLDYNYTKAQRAKLRAFDAGGMGYGKGNRVSQPSVEFGGASSANSSSVMEAELRGGAGVGGGGGGGKKKYKGGYY